MYEYDRKRLTYFIDLVLQKARAELRAEAARGYLGVFWWILEPVMYMGVFYIVFAHLFQRGDENFVIFLLTGLVAWKWFHSTLAVGSNSLIANANLMNQIYLPKIIFPLTVVAVNTVKFIIIVLLLLVFMQIISVSPTISWFYLPAIILIQLLLIVSLTTFFAAIMPFFPDFRLILENVLTMFLFLSGVFFDIAKLPSAVQGYLYLNPMAILITMYRKVLLYGSAPDWNQLLFVIMLSLLLLWLGGRLHHQYDRIYPKIIH